MAKAKTIIATLTRGKTYSMKDGDLFIRFAHGERQTVTERQRLRLEQTALDYVTRADPETDRPVGVFLPKFKFEIQSA